MDQQANRTTATDAVLSPVRPEEPSTPAPEGRTDQVAGTALCLSGGGYRAMLFHVGGLWRLNEAGWLNRLDRISSVSGGSIVSALAGTAWHRLRFDEAGVAGGFVDEIVEPLRRLAGRTIDAPSVLYGVLGPGSVADRITGSLRRHLLGEATLQDLPERPMFVINATSVQTGALWRFTRWYMGDYHVGLVRRPEVLLARAVAASAAFPPVLSPLQLRLAPGDLAPEEGSDLHREPFTTSVVLADGGVYDNLGLETAWKNHRLILCSDGGGRMAPEPFPKRDWARHAIRVMEIVDNQVRSLRKRQLIDSFVRGDRKGTYWSVRSHVADYRLDSHLPCPPEHTEPLARVPTRLRAMDARLQERLINWGYAICDTALRRHVDPDLPMGTFPYPRGLEP